MKIKPFRVILITTGFSDIIDFLFKHSDISLAGIMECRYLENNCRDYAYRNQISHCFYEDFIHMEKWITALQVDLMMTYKVPFLLPKHIFNAPQFGTINVHPSLLPHYRGVNPWLGIYYNMESESGVTIHKIDEYEDHGDILAQHSFSIVLGSPLSLLQEKVESIAINLLNRIFADWVNIKPTPQIDEPKQIHIKKYFDLEELLNLTTTDGKRLWHILRGFPSLLRKIYPMDKEYIIGNFLAIFPIEDIGNIICTIDGYLLICCDGCIQIFIIDNKK